MGAATATGDSPVDCHSDKGLPPEDWDAGTRLRDKRDSQSPNRLLRAKVGLDYVGNRTSMTEGNGEVTTLLMAPGRWRLVDQGDLPTNRMPPKCASLPPWVIRFLENLVTGGT